MAERLSRIDVDLLLALDAILSVGNVTEAAGCLGLTQPAMSARLARLRLIFGDRLFVPATSARGVVSTPRATALRSDLQTVLRSLRLMLEPSEAFEPARSERAFVAAMPDNPAAMLAPRLLSALRREAPLVRLSIVAPPAAALAAGMEEGGIDIAVVPVSAANSAWIGRALLQERFVTALRKGHPRADAVLDLDSFCALDHVVVSAQGGVFSGMLDEALARLGRRRRVAASVQSYALAPLVVEATDLACTLPERLFSRFTETLSLFAPPLPLDGFALSAFWHPRNQDDPGHLWFRERLVASARDPASE